LTQDVLDAWLDGRVGRHAAHLAGCPTCAAALGRYERLSELLRSAPDPQPRPGACAEVLKAVASARAAGPAVATRVLASAAVFCIMAIAYGAWVLVPRGEGALVGGIHCRASRQPLPEAWVALVSGDEVIAVQSTAARRGGFRFTHLRAGPYRVVPVAVGAALPAGAPVTVEGRRTTRLPLWLDLAVPRARATGSVAGRVADSRAHAPLAGALVVAEQHGVAVSTALSGPDGRYALVSPAAGTFAVWAYAAGYRPLRLGCAAPGPDEASPLDLPLQRP